MEKKTKSKKKINVKKVVAISAGVAALGTAAYLLLGPKGKQNRKIVKDWTVKMKEEIVKEFKKAKKITEPVYHDVVNKVHAKYAKFKNIDKKELAKTVAEIKKHWKKIEKKSKTKKVK